MKPVRLPRFRTVDLPPGLVITDRDRRILREVYRYRLMTREQIQALLFPPERGQDHPTKTSICRKRLKLLYHNRYLERIPAPLGPGLWAWRPVYRLAKRGAEIVAAELGIPLAELAYWGQGPDCQGRRSQVSLLFLEHAILINDVHVACALAAAARGYRIEQWIDDTELKRLEMKDYVRINQERIAVVPDAYCALDLGDRKAHFVLELDRATMTRERWKKRIRAYRAYVETGKYYARFHTRSLRILTVTTTAKRLASLLAATEPVAGAALASQFWFTTLDQVTAKAVFDEPIWTVPGRGDAQRLIV